LHARIKKTALSNGLLSYPMGGTVDGRKGDHILLAPPFITTQNELHEIASRLRTAIDQVIAEVQPLEAAVHG
jgi:adenosylmethionine-8-amino-7-oxononanoate aminotransferase